MCVTLNNPANEFLCFDHSQYEKEIALFHELKEKLLKKVEKNEPKLSYDKFKKGLTKIDHENLKK